MHHNPASAEKDTCALLLQCCDHDGDVATPFETELLGSVLLNQMSQEVYFPIKGCISLQTLQQFESPMTRTGNREASQVMAPPEQVDVCIHKETWLCLFWFVP